MVFKSFIVETNDALKPLLKSNKILTITGDTSFAEGGEVSVGVMDKNGKMVITVNLSMQNRKAMRLLQVSLNSQK